jgi:hypothetical protein
VQIRQHIGLPETQNNPACRLKCISVLEITLDVSSDFGHPVRSIVPTGEFRNAGLEIAPMPKVTVAEDRNSATQENDVWTAWQPHVVNAVPKPPLP